MNNKVIFAALALGALILAGCSSTAGPDEHGRVPLGYLPARMYDFLDIFKVNASLDHGFNLYLVGSIEPFALGGGYYDSEKLGFDGRKVGRWSEERAEIGLLIESFAKYEKTPLRGNRYLFDEAYSPFRNTWDTEGNYFYEKLGMTCGYLDTEHRFLDIMVECHLVNLGLDLGVSVQETIDFLAGIACVDVVSDDDWENPGFKGHPWPFFPEPELEGTIAPADMEEPDSTPAEPEPVKEPDPVPPEPAIPPVPDPEPMEEPEPAVIEPVPEPIPEPEPVPEPEPAVIDPVVEPIEEPIPEPEPVPEPEPAVIDPVSEPVAEPIIEPEPIPEPEPAVIEPIPEPIEEPTTEPEPVPLPEPEAAAEPEAEPPSDPKKESADGEETDQENTLVVKEDPPEEAPKIIPIESEKKKTPPEKFPPVAEKNDDKKKKKKKKIPIWDDDILNP